MTFRIELQKLHLQHQQVRPSPLAVPPKHNTSIDRSMASSNQPILHFAGDPHPLGQTQYRHDEAGLCNICLLKLAGLSSVTYGCYICNIHLHSACARYFPETISFFAHPEDTLKLRRSPGRICDICRGDCPEKSFVYSCTGCGFDVHPLCSMLPESVASPLDPSHRLCMFSSESPGSCCSACHHPLPRWHYIGSSIKLHIACAVGVGGTPTGATAGQGSNDGHHAAVPAVVYGAAESYGGAAAVVYQHQGSSHGADRQRSLFGAPAPGPPAGYSPVIQVQGYGHAGGQAGNYYYAPPIHGIYYPPPMPAGGGGGGGYCASGSGQQSSFHNPSGMVSVIARFLFGTVISTLASDLISELLAASFN